MRDVSHQNGAYRVRDVRKAFEVNVKRIGRSTRDDELGLMFLGQALDFIVVDCFGVIAHAVAHDIEITAGKIEVHAVREMAAVGKAHPHHRVARIQKAEQNGFVGLRTGVRLDIDSHFDTGGLAKELLGSLDGDAFHLIHILAAAVVALARITFGVLIRQKRPLSLHNRRRRVVFARDQLNVLFLTIRLSLNELPDFAIDSAIIANGGDKKRQ